ncbi:MAG TPA: HD domain-containing protein [Dehalococcoidia bacterium]|nr:HD domain-containing protein [Dehalococcoidia bacterium]
MSASEQATVAAARYRMQQFIRALGARPGHADLAQARSLLSEPHWRLFRQMAPRDQQHAIETLRLIGMEGAPSPDLALAALLHDAGKGYVRLHERVLFVLLALWPRLLWRLSAEHGPHWRAALWRSARHAETGARLAAETGASARVADLIRRHHTRAADDRELRALIEADARA